jgi:hypothetical protein
MLADIRKETGTIILSGKEKKIFAYRITRTYFASNLYAVHGHCNLHVILWSNKVHTVTTSLN